MTDSVYVNRDQTRVVPEGSPEAAYRIHRAEAERRGILSPEAKEKPKPADKAVRKPATK